MGRNRVAVAVLLVTLVAAATIRDSNSAADDVVIFLITTASSELTHSDRPEDWREKVNLIRDFSKNYSNLANFIYKYVNDLT